MRQIFNMLIKCFLIFNSCIFSISCCNEKNGYIYFPDEAINFYNKYDSVVFQNSLNGFKEINLICIRDTGISIINLGGGCGYEDYYYSKIYFLSKDSCLNIPYFIIEISPDTTIEIISVQFGGQNVFYKSNYNSSPKNKVNLFGYNYYDVITMESYSLLSGPPILFNLEFGIIQYTRDNIIFKLKYYDI